MPKDKREASLEKIRNSKTTRCILISFKAGSTGEFRGRLRLPLSFRHFPGAVVMFPACLHSGIMAYTKNTGWCSGEPCVFLSFSTS
jgi:hypothetical protein